VLKIAIQTLKSSQIDVWVVNKS